MAVIYFAGHGVEVDGRNFLIPVDARLERSRDVDFETASLDQALNSVDGARQLRLIILDACRNNPFRARMMGSGGTRSIGQGLRSIEPGGNILVAYAAKHGTFALDGKGGNSPFAEALTEHIEKPGLEIGQLFREVRDDVLEPTGREQEPHLYGSLGREMIYLKPEETNSDPVKPPADPPEPAPFDERALELQWWEQVKASNDPAMLAQFMERFADGVFAPLARDRLAELEWTGLKNSRSAEDFGAFVKRWPGSRFEPLAQARLAALRRKAAGGGARFPWAKAAGFAGLAGGAAIAVFLWTLPPVITPTLPPSSAAGEQPNVEETAAQPHQSCDGVAVSFATNSSVCVKPGSGQSFHDCWKTATNAQTCGPEMVVVPAGSFMMGSPDDEEGRDSDEGPRREVTIAQPFAVGKFEVTFAEWDACVDDSGCKHKPEDQGWGRVDRPVINVSRYDITNEYLPWLSRKTGKSYRLLSEAEWEYAARAGTTGSFSFEGRISTDKANYNGNNTYDGSQKGEYRKKTVPVKSFDPNPWGLYQVHGNVLEWIQGCHNGSNRNNLQDRGAVETNEGCSSRFLRGGAWYFNPEALRSARRIWSPLNFQSSGVGFRVARTL